MRLEDTTLSIIIPCYNERENIIKILDKIDEVQGFKKEIIVVDDCSNDGTRDILKTQVEERVAKLVYHEKNGGKGAALKTGFSQATGDVVIIQDADLEYDPMEYKDVILPIVQGKAKVVYGSRFKASPSKGYLANRLANKFLTFLSNIFTHQKLTDMERSEEHTATRHFDAKSSNRLISKKKDLALSRKLQRKYPICVSEFMRFRFHIIREPMKKVRKLDLKMD